MIHSPVERPGRNGFRGQVGLATAMTLWLQGCAGESIVQDGRARASIIVPSGAPVEVMRAAKELQTDRKSVV